MASKRGLDSRSNLEARRMAFDENIAKKAAGRDGRGGLRLNNHVGVFHRPGSNKK